MATEAQVEKYWKEKEEALGGKILFQTYATLIGEAGSNNINGRGGLFFIVGDRLYFEDFEKQNALMALFNRKDDDYEKTEYSFLLSDVTAVQQVSEKDSRDCVRGLLDEDSLKSLSKLKTIFTRGFWRICLKDRPSLFFDIMDDKALFEYLPTLK